MASLVSFCSVSWLLAQDREVRARKVFSNGVLRCTARSRDAQRSGSRQCRSLQVQPLCGRSQTVEECGGETLVLNRRLGLLLAGFMLSSMSEGVQAEGEGEPFSLELYEDEKEGFTLLRPAAWNKVEKAGATLLFEDPVTKSNTVGVVVNPVRIASLKDFGTADVVAEKLIRAEKNKPSTNDATLVRVQERDANGRPLYEVEYLLDSSRGQKRVLSAVTIAFKKLYILNVSYNDSPSKPIAQDVAGSLEQIVNSFNLLR